MPKEFNVDAMQRAPMSRVLEVLEMLFVARLMNENDVLCTFELFVCSDLLSAQDASHMYAGLCPHLAEQVISHWGVAGCPATKRPASLSKFD